MSCTNLDKGNDAGLYNGLRVSSILLCDNTWEVFSDPDFTPEDEFDLGQTILRPVCSITEPNLIATIVSEMNTAPSATQVALSGILCYLVFLDSSSNVIGKAHIINYKATIAQGDAIRKGDFFTPKGTSRRYLISKPIARIVYDILLEKYPNRIKEMDEFYLEACQKTTKELLLGADIPVCGGDDDLLYDVIHHHNGSYTVNGVVVGKKRSDLRDYLARQKRGSVTFYSERKMLAKTKDEIKAIFAGLNFHVKQFRVPLSMLSYSSSTHPFLFKEMEGEELEQARAKLPKDVDASKVSFVKLTDDQTLLMNIATNGLESTYVREAAISGLTDQRLLSKIATNDETWWIRQAATQQLKKLKEQKQ